MAKVTDQELDDYRGVLDDEGDVLTAVLEPDQVESPSGISAEDDELLTKLTVAIGPTALLGESELVWAFGLDGPSIHHAENIAARNGVTKRLNRIRKGTIAGFLAADVAAYIRDYRGEWKPTAVAQILLAPPADFLDDVIADDTTIAIGRASQLLNLEEQQLRQSFARGTHSHVSGHDVKAWVRGNKITPRLSVAAAFDIWRRRKLARDENQYAPPPDGETLVDRAFGKLQEQQMREAESENEHRLQGFARYREILNRRDNPNPDDHEVLSSLCEGLGLTRERVNADIALLTRAIELEGIAAVVEVREREVEEAGAAKRETEARHKTEAEASKKRLSKAWDALNEARKAGPALAELKHARPELFQN